MFWKSDQSCHLRQHKIQLTTNSLFPSNVSGFNERTKAGKNTFRMIQLDQSSTAFVLETLSAPHYGVNNDSGD